MSSFSDYDEISPEEQLKIAKHYLLSSPPGQFTEVPFEWIKLIAYNNETK